MIPNIKKKRWRYHEAGWRMEERVHDGSRRKRLGTDVPAFAWTQESNYTLCGAYEGNFGLSGNLLPHSRFRNGRGIRSEEKWEEETDYLAQVGGDSDMGSITIMGGGGSTNWEFFSHFDAYDKASIKGTAEFFNVTQNG